jgi:hypothetical protein
VLSTMPIIYPRSFVYTPAADSFLRLAFLGKSYCFDWPTP